MTFFMIIRSMYIVNSYQVCNCCMRNSPFVYRKWHLVHCNRHRWPHLCHNAECLVSLNCFCRSKRTSVLVSYLFLTVFRSCPFLKPLSTPCVHYPLSVLWSSPRLFIPITSCHCYLLTNESMVFRLCSKPAQNGCPYSQPQGLLLLGTSYLKGDIYKLKHPDGVFTL